MTGKTLIHLLKVLFDLEKPHSQTTQSERLCLQKYASGKKRLVEIGVYEGLTTVEIARVMAPNGNFHAIDPFFKGRLGVCWSKLITIIHLKRNGVIQQVSLVEKFSHDAVDTIPGNFDFIFIDGDHSIEGITRDYTDWSKRIEPGGILALHDTSVPGHNQNVEKLGSYKYFQEIIKYDAQFNLLETVDSLNILRKTGSVQHV